MNWRTLAAVSCWALLISGCSGDDTRAGAVTYRPKGVTQIEVELDTTHPAKPQLSIDWTLQRASASTAAGQGSDGIYISCEPVGAGRGRYLTATLSYAKHLDVKLKGKDMQLLSENGGVCRIFLSGQDALPVQVRFARG